MIKNWNSARGARINCPNFDPCPLCYGCRNYNSAVVRCDKCLENKKFNICDREFHSEHNLGLMLKHKNRTYIGGK